jgi:hypothetical protein
MGRHYWNKNHCPEVTPLLLVQHLQIYSGFMKCIQKSSKNISGDLDSVSIHTDKFYTLSKKEGMTNHYRILIKM